MKIKDFTDEKFNVNPVFADFAEKLLRYSENAHQNRYGNENYRIHYEYCYFYFFLTIQEKLTDHELKQILTVLLTHDVIEDTNITLSEIVESIPFDTNSFDALKALTKPSDMPDVLAKPYSYAAIAKNETAHLIKIIDRIANVSYAIENGIESKFFKYYHDYIFNEFLIGDDVDDFNFYAMHIVQIQSLLKNLFKTGAGKFRNSDFAQRDDYF